MEYRQDIARIEGKYNCPSIQKIQEIITNYKGVSYKIYAEVIRYKLEKKVEIKNMIPESQAGFRRGRSTTEYFHIDAFDAKGKKSGRRKEKNKYDVCGFKSYL